MKKVGIRDRKVNLRYLGYFSLMFVLISVVVIFFIYGFQPKTEPVHRMPEPVAVQPTVLNITSDSTIGEMMDEYFKGFGFLGNSIVVFGIICGILAVFAGILSVLRNTASW